MGKRSQLHRHMELTYLVIEVNLLSDTFILIQPEPKCVFIFFYFHDLVEFANIDMMSVIYKNNILSHGNKYILRIFVGN